MAPVFTHLDCFRLGTEGRYSITNLKMFLRVFSLFCSADILSRVFTRVYDVRGGGGAIFSKNRFIWYNSWGPVDPTLTVSIPDYGSCIYSSGLF